MSLNIGRKGRLYVVKEAGSLGGNGAGYGQAQNGASGSNTLSAAAKGLRHLDFKAAYDPYNRVNSNEKKTSPGRVVDLDRRTTAALSSLTGIVRPSGTLGTVPEMSAILEAAMGTLTNVTLATTVNDVAATTTGATLTSVTGLAKFTPISIVVNGAKYVRFLTAAPSGSAVTWAPALPSAPANGAVVKAGIGVTLSTDLSISLAILHCLTGFRRELRGVGIDKLALNFDANAEIGWSASGPAANQVSDSAAVADPTSFTQVGGNPPNGLVGDMLIGSTSYPLKKAGVDLTNGLAVRNEEYGSNSDAGIASELYRAGRRDVGITLEAFVETAATLYDLAKAGTRSSFFNQTGRTEGNIFALYAPQVYWHVADTDEPEGAASWSFKGEARESSDGSNDELMIAFL